MNTPTTQNWQRLRVLVLNSTYQALSEVPAERAVSLLAIGAAESVVDHEPTFPIRSLRTEIPLPATVRLLEYVYVPHRHTATDGGRASYAGVFRRDRSSCAYCASPVATTIDHVLPRSRGGANSWGNLVACCMPCNRRKADRTPEEAGMTLLWEPKVPNHIEKAERRIWRRLETIRVPGR
jgi:hypothetical protein